MKHSTSENHGNVSADSSEITPDEVELDRVEFNFSPTRRDVLQALGAGLMLAIAVPAARVQGAQGGGGRGRGGGGGRPGPIAARIHLGKDGSITVMTGKVECGQGARAEITQAAAEELRVSYARVNLVMADTLLCPDDGVTAGSRTTPSTIPSIRQGAAAARELLAKLAAKRWNVEAAKLKWGDGSVSDPAGGKTLSYSDLASDDEAQKAFQDAPAEVSITAIKDWKVLGAAALRPNARDLVAGVHRYPSDIVRPGMMYGRVLRAPSYGAKLVSIDLAPAMALTGVIAVQDNGFIAVAAPSSTLAEQALGLLEKSAKWDQSKGASSKTLFEDLRRNARGIPANPFADEVAKSAKSLKQSYHVAYAQHAPMEPRAAVAEWENGKLTVWTGTQNPPGVRGELARAFNLGNDRVRVIVPDFGGGFGGKHSGECAVECARIAQSAGKPVWLRWTREEEFTHAYFRPAGVIEAQASLSPEGMLTSWHFININSGPSALESPYKIAKSRAQVVQSNPPLRQGSYRGLASTANTFARECFMDELAALAGREPLEFRLAHLDNPRLRAVLEAAAKGFNWAERSKKKEPNIGIGLSCGTEKGSYTAACAEVFMDRENDAIRVRHVSQAFECGAILNPAGLLSQVQGAIVMGLGPALREEMRFEDGRVISNAFSEYKVPRFADVPTIDVQLVNRPDLASVGAGETPIIAIAPAIANAVFNATGVRVRQMPIKLPKA